MSQIMAMKNDGVPGNYQASMNNLNSWQSAHPGADPFAAAPAPASSSAPANALATASPAAAPLRSPASVRRFTAFNNFANSAGMQFQLIRART
jgi:hypothetical protein